MHMVILRYFDVSWFLVQKVKVSGLENVSECLFILPTTSLSVFARWRYLNITVQQCIAGLEGGWSPGFPVWLISCSSFYTVVLWYFPALTLLVVRQEGRPACRNVGWWWRFDWSKFARLYSSSKVVTTTSFILSSNKLQNGDVLVPVCPGCHGNWSLNERCAVVILWCIQEIVVMLEDQMKTLVQAEMSVLVDILYHPEVLFLTSSPAHHSFASGGFMTKYGQLVLCDLPHSWTINHTLSHFGKILENSYAVFISHIFGWLVCLSGLTFCRKILFKVWKRQTYIQIF